MTDTPIDHDATAIGVEALDRSGVGWWRVRDPETCWWSPSMYALYGLDPAGAVPTPEEIFRLYHPDDTNHVARMWRALLSDDKPVEMRHRIIRPDGEVRHVFNRAQRQPADAQGHRWVVGLSFDVTSQLDDQKLFESERAFRFVAENTHDMVVRTRIDGGMLFVSPASRHVLGYSPSEMLTRAPAEFVHPDDLGWIRALLHDRIARQELVGAASYEYRAIHKAGHEVWLEANPRLVLNGAGELTEMVDVVRDVTARKQADAVLETARRDAEAARAEAEAAAAAKSEFLANMSHELRTPLTSILGFSRLIGTEGGLSDTDRRHLDLIQRAGETLLTVVNDILDFSKLEAGAVTLDAAPFSTGELIEGVVALLAAQAGEKGLTLSSKVDADVRLCGDSPRLRQVLLNLVGNAVKFTDCGSVRVEATTSATDGGGAILTIEVVDTGVGVDPEHIERLFDRFTQGDGSVSRRFGGTGLGLAISRRLIGLMGGEIGARSDGATGSTFWFRVPLNRPTADVSASNASPDGLPDRPLHILLAEDNPANRLLVAALLKPFDMRLDTVENGAEAVEAVARKAYDLILMDMQMPVMDGPAAARAIRASGGVSHDTPIIALTANVLPEQIAQCRAAGMQAHLAKPIDPAALISAIAEHARSPDADVRAA